MNATLPLVSIVLPAYNGAKYLRQSIDSCLSQTHRNLELIVVDDHSTDETPEIVRSYEDTRVRLVRHETNRGLPRALNTGFAAAAGEYLTWTSDDNLYTPNAIEKMLHFLQRDGCGLVYCDFYEFKDDNLAQRELIRLPEKPALDQVNCVRACFLYRRDVKEAVGDYDPDTLLCEDYDYWIRISQSFPLGHLGEPLYFYRLHGGTLSTHRYWEVVLVKHLLLLKHHLRDTSQVTDALTQEMARRWRVRGCPRRLKRLVARALYSGRIQRRLTAFQEGRLGFVELRDDLNALVNGAPRK